MKPRIYQIDFVNKIVKKISDGYNRIVCQLSTGAGKTVCMSYLISRYLNKNISGKVAILVHRQELVEQTKNTLSKFNIFNVPVLMVETFNNQIKKHGLTQLDLLIIDEAHFGSHKKIVDFYKPTKTIIIGFSATPKSASKKSPLKADYQTIVVGLDINSLIKQGDLCPAIHHGPDSLVNTKAIKVTGGEYNMADMAIEFSKPKLVDAVLHAYRQFSDGKKTLIFNTTIEHSNLVNECFKNAGYPSRSIDSKSVTDEVRKETFKWLKETPGAILNNVGIATTGFDDPSIECIIFNRKTKSLPLWLQCCGRGARVNPESGKEYFIIIDLGNNIEGEGFGHWNERHDWGQIFHNPDKSSDGVAPMKKCPECEARIYMSSTVCIWCGHEMPRETVYTDMVLTLKILPDAPIRKNSHDALTKAIEHAANKIKLQKITINEKRELMFYSFKTLYERSSFEPKTHILSHLVSVYGK